MKRNFTNFIYQIGRDKTHDWNQMDIKVHRTFSSQFIHFYKKGFHFVTYLLWLLHFKLTRDLRETSYRLSLNKKLCISFKDFIKKNNLSCSASPPQIEWCDKIIVVMVVWQWKNRQKQTFKCKKELELQLIYCVKDKLLLIMNYWFY